MRQQEQQKQWKRRRRGPLLVTFSLLFIYISLFMFEFVEGGITTPGNPTEISAKRGEQAGERKEKESSLRELVENLIQFGVAGGGGVEEEGQKQQTHTNNWAVLVSTSKFWYNYRHTTNALAFYRILKRFGIPDSNIVLMLAEDTACNARNPYPATHFAKAGAQWDEYNPLGEENEEEGEDEDEQEDALHNGNLYADEIEVDYRGAEVSVENFIRVLTGRHLPSTPRSKRLLSDDRSNVLVFITGHGGEDFMKFQNMEEISSRDLADVVEQMRQQRRYNELLLIGDTCQASSLFRHVHSPGVVSIGSSRLGESSFSHKADWDIGASLIDRFTYYTMKFFDRFLMKSKNNNNFHEGGSEEEKEGEKLRGLEEQRQEEPEERVEGEEGEREGGEGEGESEKQGKERSREQRGKGEEEWTLGGLFDSYSPALLSSNADWRSELLGRNLYDIPVTDFFGYRVDVILDED